MPQPERRETPSRRRFLFLPVTVRSPFTARVGGIGLAAVPGLGGFPLGLLLLRLLLLLLLPALLLFLGLCLRLGPVLLCLLCLLCALLL